MVLMLVDNKTKLDNTRFFKSWTLDFFFGGFSLGHLVTANSQKIPNLK